MEVVSEDGKGTKTIDIVCKTAQVDKNPKFESYLQEELQII